MKNSIKRAQSQACLGFAERKNFRPLAKLKKLTLTLLLLITAAAGAWAQDTYNVQFKANGNTKTVENVTLPYTFKCDLLNEDGELDLIIKQLYGLSKGCCGSEAPTSSGSENVTGGSDGDSQFITISAPFEGTATVIGIYADSNRQGFYYSLEISIPGYIGGPDVTTNAASAQDLFTTASFKMPASDVTVNYTLVRDMQDATNPVAFSGLPSSGNIIVKKGDDGKYQPAETLTIQLIDPVAAAEAQNIIAADGITIKVLVGAVNGQGAIDYDQDNPITLDAFLADMTPGYYWIKAEPTDENSPYDGTVYSSEFTVVEQYDLTVKPANDFSKGKIESVTVGTETVTPDATTGEATKTGVAPDTEVKLKAKRGYIIEKVETGKTVFIKLNAATAENIGMVVCNKGHLHDAKTAVPAGCTAVGILGKVTATGHGLILALKNAEKQTWNTINGWESVTTYAGTTLKVLPDDAARGTNLTSYTTLGETTVSNWAVAQKSDYEAIFTNLGSTTGDQNGKVYDDNVNAYITGAGGTAMADVYWSTTEYNVKAQWNFYYYCWYVFNKTNNISVWPVIGF